jgi:diketogulonate reductase-like aldo/keto reductase
MAPGAPSSLAAAALEIMLAMLAAALLVVVAQAKEQETVHGPPLGPNVTLRGGVVMPTISMGSGGSCHPDPDGTEKGCKNYQTTLQWFKLGGRGVHDALSYQNQAGLGAAIADSNLSRKELFVMSMVPTYLMGYNETIAAVHASLEQMKLNVLDLVMVHHRAPVRNGQRTHYCTYLAARTRTQRTHARTHARTLLCTHASSLSACEHATNKRRLRR